MPEAVTLGEKEATLAICFFVERCLNQKGISITLEDRKKIFDEILRDFGSVMKLASRTKF